jgi:hypothetical protein
MLHDMGVEATLNIADDGSKINPASDFFEKNPPLPNMRLFRVTEDIGFNSHGARNLLMKQTQTDWNMMSDIDRRYPIETFIDVLENVDLKQENYYSFYEVIRSSLDRFSVNEYVVHRDTFWLTGGYDEEFVNIHFGDRAFLDTLKQVATRVCMPEWKLKYARFSREVTWADVPTTIYPDDKTLIHPNNRWPDDSFRFGLKQFVEERNMTHEGRMSKKVINFDWEQVF